MKPVDIDIIPKIFQTSRIFNYNPKVISLPVECKKGKKRRTKANFLNFCPTANLFITFQ